MRRLLGWDLGVTSGLGFWVPLLQGPGFGRLTSDDFSSLRCACFGPPGEGRGFWSVVYCRCIMLYPWTHKIPLEHAKPLKQKFFEAVGGP